jgi:hypothetical protein
VRARSDALPIVPANALAAIEQSPFLIGQKRACGKKRRGFRTVCQQSRNDEIGIPLKPGSAV